MDDSITPEEFITITKQVHKEIEQSSLTKDIVKGTIVLGARVFPYVVIIGATGYALYYGAKTVKEALTGSAKEAVEKLGEEMKERQEAHRKYLEEKFKTCMVNIQEEEEKTRRKIEETERSIEKTRKEIEDMNEHMGLLIEKQKEMNTKVERIESVTSRIQDTISNLEQGLSKLEQSQARMDGNIQEITEFQSKMDDKLSKVIESTAHMEHDLKELNSSGQQLDSKITDLSTGMGALGDTLTSKLTVIEQKQDLGNKAIVSLASIQKEAITQKILEEPSVTEVSVSRNHH